MRFQLLEREIDVRWSHIGVALITLLAAVFLLMGLAGIFAGLYSLAAGMDIQESYFLALEPLNSIFLVVAAPVTAFLLLLVGSLIFRLKKEVSLCRSLAAADFMIGLVMFLIPLAFLLFLGMTSLYSYYLSPFQAAASVLSYITGPIIIYLWLLIFLKPEKERVRKAALYAGVFAIIFFLFSQVYWFLSYYSSGGIYTPVLDGSDVLWLMHKFLLGFALLYFSKDIKRLGKEAYLYAALVLGKNLFLSLDNLLGPGWAASGPLLGVMDLVMAAAMLALIYLISLKMEEG